MVSPKLSTPKRDLAEAFKKLASYKTSGTYTGVIDDAESDIISCDTFVAGIADTILNHKTVPYENRAFLKQVSLVGSSYRLPDGHEVDLTQEPELLQYARLIEEVRRLCAEILNV
jgi:hypothetical protein